MKWLPLRLLTYLKFSVTRPFLDIFLVSKSEYPFFHISMSKHFPIQALVSPIQTDWLACFGAICGQNLEAASFPATVALDDGFGLKGSLHHIKCLQEQKGTGNGAALTFPLILHHTGQKLNGTRGPPFCGVWSAFILGVCMRLCETEPFRTVGCRREPCKLHFC